MVLGGGPPLDCHENTSMKKASHFFVFFWHKFPDGGFWSMPEMNSCRS